MLLSCTGSLAGDCWPARSQKSRPSRGCPADRRCYPPRKNPLKRCPWRWWGAHGSTVAPVYWALSCINWEMSNFLASRSRCFFVVTLLVNGWISPSKLLRNHCAARASKYTLQGSRRSLRGVASFAAQKSPEGEDCCRQIDVSRLALSARWPISFPLCQRVGCAPGNSPALV